MTSLYEQDSQIWLRETTELLRENRWQEIEIEHLIEELETLGKSEKRAISSQLTRLLLHLLKWQYQPQRRSDSWLDSITDSRTQIELAIADSPSLKNYSPGQLEPSYQRAKRQASKQTGLSVSIFPDDCPYSLDLILDENWLPDQKN